MWWQFNLMHRAYIKLFVGILHVCKNRAAKSKELAKSDGMEPASASGALKIKL